ncbi:MAG: ribosome silencing factor [Acidobacteria bacterium]|nr:ribosome silencing factor [Acidobacteriota bacterium]
MEEVQEKTLHRESLKIEIPKVSIPFAELDPEVQLAVRCAAEKKGLDIKVLDLRQIATFTEFFIIVGGANQRQVQAIADEITERLKKDLQTRAVRIEGYVGAEWVLIDFGDFIVHIFDKDAREFYDLERLWRDAQKVDLPEL